MTEKEFRRWCQFNSEEPLGDTENAQLPIAALRADMININRASNTEPVKIKDMLLFNRQDGDDIEAQLLSEDW